MNTIPKTVLDWIKPHMQPMIIRARANKTGCCNWRDGNRLAIYAHSIALPELKETSETVHVEWTSNAGYSDDPMSFTGTILRGTDASRVNVATLTFAEALAL